MPKVEEVKVESTKLVFPDGAYFIVLDNGVRIEKCASCKCFGAGVHADRDLCGTCLRNAPPADQHEIESTPTCESMKNVPEEVAAIPSSNVTTEILKPNFKFRQSPTCAYIMISMEGIDESSIILDCLDDAVTLFFMCKGVSYGFSITLAGRVDPSKCRHALADKNMMIILQKNVNECVLWKSLEKDGAVDVNESSVPLAGELFCSVI